MAVPGDDAGVDIDGLLRVLADGARAARDAFESVPLRDRRRPGGRPGQYHIDIVADDAVCEILHTAGLRVLSEESGLTGPEGGDGDLLVVVDPIDGTTNASLGIPWYATSFSILDAHGMLASLVVNQASGTVYEAVRGGGASRDGRNLEPSGTTSLLSAVVAVSGLPASHPGWAQFRALGAASLDICAVAEGMLDAYCVVGTSALYGWDYLGALLVCHEAGAVAGERDGKDLLVRDASVRRPIVAATPSLLAELSGMAL